jgi:Zn-finger nucleic acid-binding protein
MPDAQTLSCPMCGAPTSSTAAACEHCGARLATVACPSCFGLMFLGQKFCPHCGAKAQRTEVASGPTQLCPRCHVSMEAIVLGKANLRECPHCAGIWADADTLRQICADREEQAAVLGMAEHVPTPDTVPLEQQIRYVPCPVCQKLMNRVNFANCSHVVVDVCMRHGTWFDKDELRRIVEFIRAGGLEQSRARELADLEERRCRAAAQNPDAWVASAFLPDTGLDGRHLGVSAAAAVLKSLLR